MKKTFDCVDMKHRAQRKLREEYERRQSEFASYADFLTAKAEESEWQRNFWKSVRTSKANVAS